MVKVAHSPQSRGLALADDLGSVSSIRQVTSGASIHHHPFFFVPAYDDRMNWLYFISEKTGSPQIFAESQSDQSVFQLTDREDLAEWSVIPSPDGKWVYFVAGNEGWRVSPQSGAEEQMVTFETSEMRERGMTGAAMGTTALSRSGRWWAIPVKFGAISRFVLVDTEIKKAEIIIEKDTIGHPQFCPDDEDLILYAGPLTDRVWITDRSGRQNRRLYEREHDQQWITHESWWPGQRKVLMVDWPHGIKSVDVGTGEVVQVTHVPAWHAAADSLGERIVCDTNFPDIGIQLIDLKEHEISDGKLLFESNATSRGDHWAHPFPYNNGPITVYAPQHTHPHPRFSPDGERVVFTSDCTGFAHVYEIVLRKSEAKAHA